MVLVEGYIDSEENKLFVLREIVEKIACNTGIVIDNEDLSALVGEKVENIKRKFLGLGIISKENILKISKESNLKNDFDFIKEYELKLENLNEEQSYSLFIISIFYNIHNELIDNLNVLKRFLALDTYENRFVKVIENQVINGENNITVYNFIEENRENIIKVDKLLLEHIFNIAKKYLPINYTELLQVKEVPTYCFKHEARLEKNIFVIEFVNINKKNKRIKVVKKIDSCPLCKIAYINEKSLELLNNQYPGYKCVVNNEKNKIRDILYKESLKSYINGTTTITKENIVKIINDENLSKDLNRTKISTLMILGSFLGVGSTQLELAFKPHRFGIGYEHILYKRLRDNERFYDYLISNKDNFRYLDPLVKKKMLEELTNKALIIENSYKNKIKNSEVDGSNLNAESQLKKLGYSTSLGRDARRNLLINKAIPKLGERKIISHISWLIRVNGNRKDRVNAVQEWKHDLEMLLGR